MDFACEQRQVDLGTSSGSGRVFDKELPLAGAFLVAELNVERLVEAWPTLLLDYYTVAVVGIEVVDSKVAAAGRIPVDFEDLVHVVG